MGNFCASNEPTLQDKLQHQLCRIVLEYEKLELICGYIAIFEMCASQRTALSTSMSHHSSNVSPELLSAIPNHSNSISNNDGDNEDVSNGSIIQHTAQNTQQNAVNTQHNVSIHSYHAHSSSTRSNLKVKEKKEIQKIIDLDYKQFYEWKINEIMKRNPNITEQELADNHGLILNTSSNNIFSKSNPLISIFKDDEKENLLQKENMMSIHDAPSSTNNIHHIKDILKNNDIKSSVQSLGDTTDQLLQILDRAKILQLHANNLSNAQNNKIIHIRGNKQTIFSYYLILNRYIIISYAQSKSEYLSFMEWIKIQGKLEKLQITLKDIQALLGGDTKN
eukprot:5083_1